MSEPVIPARVQNASVNWAIDVIELLRPGPGDIVVVKVSKHATESQCRDISHILSSKNIRHIICKDTFPVDISLMQVIDLVRLREQIDQIIKEFDRALPF